MKYSHLKCNLSKASGTFDVETEDGKSHVQLIHNGLFACVELLPLVDVFSTCFTPANNQSAIDDKQCHIAHLQRLEGVGHYEGSKKVPLKCNQTMRNSFFALTENKQAQICHVISSKQRYPSTKRTQWDSYILS